MLEGVVLASRPKQLDFLKRSVQIPAGPNESFVLPVAEREFCGCFG